MIKRQSTAHLPQNLIASRHRFEKIKNISPQAKDPVSSDQFAHKPNRDLSLEKKGTNSTLLGSNYIYKADSQNEDEGNLSNYFEFPLSSDGDTISNEARYMSFMDFQKVQHRKRSSSYKQSEQNAEDEEKNEKLKILYRSIIYLRKQQMRSEIDDSLFLEEISWHIKNGTCPEPTTEVGKQLCENGYFLAALAVLKARIHRSHFLLGYLFNYFQNNFQIEENYFQFREYKERSAASFNIQVVSQNLGRSTKTSMIEMKRDPEKLMDKIEIKQCSSEDFSISYKSQEKDCSISRKI